MLVSWIGYIPGGCLPDFERVIESNSKPLPKLSVICNGPPDPRNRRCKLNDLFDPVLVLVYTHYATSWLRLVYAILSRKATI